MLGLDRDHSSEMACSMEHYVDAVTEERLYALLEYFRKARAEHQPWVDEIFLAIEKPVLLAPVPLTLCDSGSEGAILRITADEPLRKQLVKKGFVIGAEVKLIDNDDETFTCQLSHDTVNLPLNEAAAVWIQQPAK